MREAKDKEVKPKSFGSKKLQQFDGLERCPFNFVFKGSIWGSVIVNP
jgi:hypothetical protein